MNITREEAIDKLASEVFDWDLDTLLDYAYNCEYDHIRQLSDSELEERIERNFAIESVTIK